jgi:hypothetical protein
MPFVIAQTVDVLCCDADRVVTIHMTTSGPQAPSLAKARGTMQHQRDCGHGVTQGVHHIPNCTHCKLYFGRQLCNHTYGASDDVVCTLLALEYVSSHTVIQWGDL